ncbi:MAG: SDR family oxidoreductase [Dermatophilaceae bacterium]
MTTLSMSGRTVLVTGATNGIGLATAEALARLGAHVGVVGRNPERTEAVVGRLRAAAPEGSLGGHVADLSDLAQVRRLADEVTAAYPRLDVLVNNAGGVWATRRVTVDGFEHTFAVNHLAPFLLTHLLLPRLRESAPARVVTVSSAAHALGRIDFEDLGGAKGYSGQRAYNQSKLANVLFTVELARRTAGQGVTANAMHPGVVRSGFAAEDPSLMMRLGMPLVRPLMRSPERAATTAVYLASSPDVADVTGAYFADSKRREPAARARDLDAARRLWKVSAEMVGIPPG